MTQKFLELKNNSIQTENYHMQNRMDFIKTETLTYHNKFQNIKNHKAIYKANREKAQLAHKGTAIRPAA